MGITATLFTADFLEKLKLMYPNTAQALREATFQAIGLVNNFASATNFKAWEQDIPIIGFFLPSTNIQYESILKTSVTVDATGGETVVKEAAGELGAIIGGGKEGTQRLQTLLKLLESGS
jgi:hypothetical protein